MSSIIQKYNRKVKEGFSKKLPTWAIILIVFASVYGAYLLFNYFMSRATY